MSRYPGKLAEKVIWVGVDFLYVYLDQNSGIYQDTNHTLIIRSLNFKGFDFTFFGQI